MIYHKKNDIDWTCPEENEECLLKPGSDIIYPAQKSHLPSGKHISHLKIVSPTQKSYLRGWESYLPLKNHISRVRSHISGLEIVSPAQKSYLPGRKSYLRGRKSYLRGEMSYLPLKNRISGVKSRISGLEIIPPTQKSYLRPGNRISRSEIIPPGQKSYLPRESSIYHEAMDKAFISLCKDAADSGLLPGLQTNT